LKEFHLTSIDFSSEFVNDAEQTFGQLLRGDARSTSDHMGHFTFDQMDGMDLRFPDGSFNGVTAMFSVMFFPDPVQGLREIHRVLYREGGVAVVSSWAPVRDVEWVWFSNKAIVSIMKEHPDKFAMPEGMTREQRKHNAFMWDRSEQLACDMTKAGFCADAVEVKTVKKRFAIQSRQDAKAMWKQMAIAFPTVDYFVKAVQCTGNASEEMFRDLVADRYADLLVDRDPDDLYVEGTAYFAIGRN
jgi:SAM-dependent methyltransferase